MYRPDGADNRDLPPASMIRLERRDTSGRTPTKTKRLVGTGSLDDLNMLSVRVNERRKEGKPTPEPGILRAAQILYLSGMPLAAICRELRVRPSRFDDFLPEWNQQRPSYAAGIRKDVQEIVRNRIEAAVVKATDQHLDVGAKLRELIGDIIGQLEAELKADDSDDDPVMRLSKIATALERLSKTYKTEADVSHRMSGIGRPVPVAKSNGSALFGNAPVRPIRVIDVGPAKPAT